MNRRRWQTIRGCGFTLLEVMIAVAIVSTLAAVAIPAYFNYLTRSRQSALLGGLMSIKAAQERYFAIHSGYAGKMNMLLAGAGHSATTIDVVDGTYTDGFCRYYISANTNALIAAGTIRVAGDPNGDGNFTDIWEVSINELDDRPHPLDASGSDEGFTWSGLARLYN